MTQNFIYMTLQTYFGIQKVMLLLQEHSQGSLTITITYLSSDVSLFSLGMGGTGTDIQQLFFQFGQFSIIYCVLIQLLLLYYTVYTFTSGSPPTQHLGAQTTQSSMTNFLAQLLGLWGALIPHNYCGRTPKTFLVKPLVDISQI